VSNGFGYTVGKIFVAEGIANIITGEILGLRRLVAFGNRIMNGNAGFLSRE
jgi:hypothetical protein